MSNKKNHHRHGGDVALIPPDMDEADVTNAADDDDAIRLSGGGVPKIDRAFGRKDRSGRGDRFGQDRSGRRDRSGKGDRSGKKGRSSGGVHSLDKADRPPDGHSSAARSSRGRLRFARSGKDRKRLIVSLSVLGAVLVAVVAAAFIAMSQIAAPLTAEVGEKVDISRLTEGFAGVICRVEGAESSPDGIPTVPVATDKIGDQSFDVTFFGFIRRSVRVSVRDTVPPKLEVRNLTVVAGSSVKPEDFVVSADDLTSLTFRFAEQLDDFDTRVERDVTIIATDEGGNETAKKAHFSCGDPALSIQAEFGETTADDIRAAFRALNPEIGQLDLSAVDLDVCGEYTASASGKDTLSLLRVTVSDTIAPSAKVHSFDLRLGESISDEDFVSDIEDHSPVTVTVGTADTDKVGNYTVPVTLEDTAGNRTELAAHLCVHDIPREVEIELGTTTKELAALLTDGDNSLALAAYFNISSLSLGENQVVLNGAYNNLTSVVTVKDTVPPKLTLKDVTLLEKRSVAPGEFVASCTDLSAVSFAFEEDVAVTDSGVRKVTVVATDAAGNRTKAQATLTVIIDTVAPVIYGVHDISLEAGGSVSYLSGVYAVDDTDGNVNVTVDHSAVNTGVAGTYTVYYSASDRSGNTARSSATVTVSPMGRNTVYAMADNILAKITNSGMTARQKARAIYDWCTSNIRYSTATSYLMGDFVQGAYSGFRTRAGNCYIYYAVASCMLTRCGIENIEISRNDPNNPHYWNLVKIDGAWYHFDTCPHYRYAPLESFLLTDAQVAAYSANSVPGYYSFDRSKYPRTP